ncbi:MAG: MFS transporter small subunit [Blastococcus sp.]
MSHDPSQPTHTPAGLLGLAWALVGIPLVYGLWQTVRTAVTLFTGG